MKKLLAAILTVAMSVTACATMTACGKKDEYKIGICQLLQHVALDAATNGFIDGLKEEAEKAGKKVTFDKQNAQGESTTCSTIVNKFVTSKYDLILANATPALQAAVSATDSIPILGTSITEYGVALDIQNFNGKTGINVSGTSDLAPLESQAQMILDLVPTAKKIGIIYCSSEANSVYQGKVVKDYLNAKDGITAEIRTFSDSNDLSAVVTAASNEFDAIYVPTDNTVADNTSIIDNICRPKKIPVIAGEEGICEGCGIATLSINYYELGKVTGKMAARILFEGADVSKMDIEYYQNPVKKYNAEIVNELGLDLSLFSDYVAIGE